MSRHPRITYWLDDTIREARLVERAETAARLHFARLADADGFDAFIDVAAVVADEAAHAASDAAFAWDAAVQAAILHLRIQRNGRDTRQNREAVAAARQHARAAVRAAGRAQEYAANARRAVTAAAVAHSAAPTRGRNGALL